MMAITTKSSIRVKPFELRCGEENITAPIVKGKMRWLFEMKVKIIGALKCHFNSQS